MTTYLCCKIFQLKNFQLAIVGLLNGPSLPKKHQEIDL